MDIVKSAIGSLELPHWLIVAGGLLVIVGLIGRLKQQALRVANVPDEDFESQAESETVNKPRFGKKSASDNPPSERIAL